MGSPHRLWLTWSAVLSSCADVECCIKFFPSVEAVVFSPVEALNSPLGMRRRATCRLCGGRAIKSAGRLGCPRRR
ncbi:hypothetical protein MRB53_000787 [Persea americana]|uniref:Uncharacterized protein n=1 Tax=Persea americana TaxID=3435 RepID=A0ACC2MQ08_PERAE|nr:hypothetical protein MRB53_000787 [Persea americana]